MDCIQEQLDDKKSLLAPYFDIKLVKESENPLYAATDNVEEELLRCPDILTNETQIRPLLDFSDRPFYVLEVKGDNNGVVSNDAVNIVTPVPSRARKQSRAVAPVVRGRRAPLKRGYVSDTSESEPSTPLKRPTRRTVNV